MLRFPHKKSLKRGLIQAMHSTQTPTTAAPNQAPSDAPVAKPITMSSAFNAIYDAAINEDEKSIIEIIGRPISDPRPGAPLRVTLCISDGMHTPISKLSAENKNAAVYFLREEFKVHVPLSQIAFGQTLIGLTEQASKAFALPYFHQGLNFPLYYSDTKTSVLACIAMAYAKGNLVEKTIETLHLLLQENNDIAFKSVLTDILRFYSSTINSAAMNKVLHSTTDNKYCQLVDEMSAEQLHSFVDYKGPKPPFFQYAKASLSHIRSGSFRNQTLVSIIGTLTDLGQIEQACDALALATSSSERASLLDEIISSCHYNKGEITKVVNTIVSYTLHYDCPHFENFLMHLSYYSDETLPNLKELIRQNAFLLTRNGHANHAINVLTRAGFTHFEILYHAAKEKNESIITEALKFVSISVRYQFETPASKLAFEGDMDAANFLREKFGAAVEWIAYGMVKGKHYTNANLLLDSAASSSTRYQIILGLIQGYAYIGLFQECDKLMALLLSTKQHAYALSNKIYYAAHGGHSTYVAAAIAEHNFFNTTQLLNIITMYAAGGHGEKAMGLFLSVQEAALKTSALQALAVGFSVTGKMIQHDHPIWALASSDEDKLSILRGTIEGYIRNAYFKTLEILRSKVDQTKKPAIDEFITNALLSDGHIEYAVKIYIKNIFYKNLSPDDFEAFIKNLLPIIPSDSIALFSKLISLETKTFFVPSSIYIEKFQHVKAMIALNIEVEALERKPDTDVNNTVNNSIGYLLKRNNAYEFILFAMNPTRCSPQFCTRIQAQLIKLAKETKEGFFLSLFNQSNVDVELYQFYLHLLLNRDTLINTHKNLNQAVIFAATQNPRVSPQTIQFLSEQIDPLSKKQFVNDSEAKLDDTPIQRIETISPSDLTTPTSKLPKVKIKELEAKKNEPDELDKLFEWECDSTKTTDTPSFTRR